ncbi:MAG: hypothetical protein R3292_04685 [Alcanivorax sp.]|nr:hypothetical protein [Alcanivorax sp.]
MHRWLSALLVAWLAVGHAAIGPLPLTGRLSLLGSSGYARPGQLGYVSDDQRTLTADQQTLRLMLEPSFGNHDLVFHGRLFRLHQQGYPPLAVAPSPFRWHALADDWLAETGSDRDTRVGDELDRLFYRYRGEAYSLTLGRQPIDWGSGRLWQPLNVFGAFSPTDLDTTFKPGIDALQLESYPSDFSSLAAVWVKAPAGSDARDSGALHYRGQVGELSELTLVAASVNRQRMLGAGWDSSWHGMGWRVEAAGYDLRQHGRRPLFVIAGLDYRFDNGVLLTGEWYHNQAAARHESELITVQRDAALPVGLRQQLSRDVLGLALDKDLSPLWHGGYLMLTSLLDNADNRSRLSQLHQFNLTYSVSNESELLLSLALGTGKGLDRYGRPQSEFGHLPVTFTVRWQLYF